MQQAKDAFAKYLLDKGIRNSRQRHAILNIFLKTEKHLTALELYNLVKKEHPGIGYATVYRSLKLLCEAGLCRELKFEDGTARYEHLYGHKHHDHLICTSCGKFVEIIDQEIEGLQEKIFKAHGFHPQRHRMELYGVCKKCKK
ncbi:MAG: transcriptional repressor [Candidatus Omnitrophica bacterium CG11_big_fil_rev_8_21_14_0_20_42_13]|uniref:Ferric uptake regulation protein n=1 Tax=Candidatus Ghiorseimicrobium undicola TaxID=1974746 RepID=A0A2H0LXP3_9BACT|nr:MAG: transcriptional repressor [Candidatus Omnitrophica bacterium CG11_big_fil_rev_8_21_14_0_20_42_13]